ncbi:MAG: ATP-binding cassette domain-containing protein [Gammaproteobacteria bacterium]|nr:MAG: ATP-binding cassette domain-containing protein [Gammaproteobacteria bacterium]
MAMPVSSQEVSIPRIFTGRVFLLAMKCQQFYTSWAKCYTLSNICNPVNHNRPMIEVKGLKKTYVDGTQALNGLDLTVEDGEIMALLGPNGAGKSTFIRILSTLSGFDDGEVKVAGYNIDLHPDKVRESIGVVAQNAGVDNFLTGRENMMLHGHFYKLPKSMIEERINELTEYFDIKDALDQVVAGYSGGMRRKLDIAMALIHKPKLIFLDEPTLGLDIKSRKGLWTYITKLNKEMGLTILLTTHYLEEADKLSDRVAIINKGVIQTIGTPEELKHRVGGDSITLNFEERPAASTGFEKALAETGLIKNRIWEGTRMHLYVDNGAESIPRIMAITTEKGLTITQLSLSGPTLDDVFLKYTGSSLEDKGEEEVEEWWMQWAGKDGAKNSKWAKNWQKWQTEGEGGEGSGSPDDDWQNNEWNKGKDSPPEDWKKWAAQAGYDVEAIEAEEAAKEQDDKDLQQASVSSAKKDKSDSSEEDWRNNEWNKDKDSPPDDWKKWASKAGYDVASAEDDEVENPLSRDQADHQESEKGGADSSDGDWQNNKWNKDKDSPPDDWKKWASKAGYDVGSAEDAADNKHDDADGTTQSSDPAQNPDKQA